jgi:hypothetical protein
MEILFFQNESEDEILHLFNGTDSPTRVEHMWKGFHMYAECP